MPYRILQKCVDAPLISICSVDCRAFSSRTQTHWLSTTSLDLLWFSWDSRREEGENDEESVETFELTTIMTIL